ncbi:MAG: sensor histidine kinase [Chloroflexi bacterium]|nr:sensor histidine kinase [Chloroflexota bacterium]
MDDGGAFARTLVATSFDFGLMRIRGRGGIMGNRQRCAVRAWIEGSLKRLSLAQQFMLASLVILVAGAVSIGWWVGQQIEVGVINRTAATTALYVESFVAPHLQDLNRAESLPLEHASVLGRLLEETSLGQYIVAFKVWDAGGRILYSTSPASIGRVFPVRGALARAWQGQMASRISDLRDEENALERERWTRLLETYLPVRLEGTNRIIAVVEFYQAVDDLQRESTAAQTRSWLVVGAATLAMYLLLAGLVRRGSDTIARQQAELGDQVVRLTGLLAQNEELHERVRRAAARTTALNERYLRRISAELHDGPAQDLGLALLRLDSVISREAMAQPSGPSPLGSAGLPGGQDGADLDRIEACLRRALQEVRAISAGLRLPELENRTLAESLAWVVRAHERRTDTKVALSLAGLPEQLSLPVKITLYRLVQEALSNAYRHGGGMSQRVSVGYEADHLTVAVSDQGPGFNWAKVADRDEHLGLVGMRERVESLGGLFRVESEPGRGTTVIAHLPLHPEEEDRER